MTEDEMVGWHHRINGRELGKLRELVQLALGIPRGMRAGTMGVQRSQSSAQSSNSGGLKEPIGRKWR